MSKPRELVFCMMNEPLGFNMVYDHVKCTAFHNNDKWGFDNKHRYIEKSAYDKALAENEELMREDYWSSRCNIEKAKADKLAQALEWYVSLTQWDERDGQNASHAKAALKVYRGE